MKVMTDPDELEEERRLCYVAITRAKRQLYLTHAKQRMLYGRTSFNRSSRFLDEIPESCLIGTGVSKSSHSDFSMLRSDPSERTVPVKPRQSTARKATTPLMEINKGDQIVHTAFGSGLVTNVLKMNGDALLEIAFDRVGTKKLMLKAASPHMKKK